MGTSVQPEPIQPNTPPESNTPPQNLDQQVPPTNQPPANNPNPLDAMAMQAYREESQKRQAAEQELATLRAQLNSNAPRIQPTADDYFANPIESNRNIVREELQSQLGTFTQDFKRMQNMQMYATLKSQARTMVPNFDKIEYLVDSGMSNLEPTALNMQNVISWAFGQLYLTNQLVPSAPSNPVPVNPPYIPPSAPPAPNQQVQGNAPAPLTELERRMMREAGFKTEEEFIKFRDMPFNQLVPK